MKLSSLFSPCLLGHAADPITVVVEGKKGMVMRYECRRCQADLGAVLKGQKFKARKEPKRFAVVTRKVIGRVG